MKKQVLCFLVGLSLVVPHVNVKAGNSISNAVAPVSSDQQIRDIYDAISFGNANKPSYEVFATAYHGYMNLKAAGKLSGEKQILTICDMSLSSTQNRMWIIDLDEKKLLLNTYVAHGQGSGDEYACKFSNQENSHQSSLGFYVTGETYIGEHGNSLYLHGMDKGYNDRAYERNIVVHGADYVNANFVAGNQRLGRSWGCPAVSSKLSDKVIGMIKDGTCLFMYYPQQQYLQASAWLKKSATMPNEFDNLLIAQNKTEAPKVIYEFSPKMQAMVNSINKIKLPLF